MRKFAGQAERPRSDARFSLGWPTLAIVLAAALAFPAVSSGFDTAPHSDISRDAMLAEGFTPTAADVAVINNYLVDFYTNAGKVPQSGHDTGLHEALAGTLIDGTEDWSDATIKAAGNLHFDSSVWGVKDAASAEREWTRLQRNTTVAAQVIRDGTGNRPRKMLAILGITLHEVQDFYAHSNWMDNMPTTLGSDGPRWAEMVAGPGSSPVFGTTPTWFDIPKAVRASLDVYVGNQRCVDQWHEVNGVPKFECVVVRHHGPWNADGNHNKKSGVNADWPGRPGYDGAYLASYFATRQWVRAFRSLVSAEMWQQMLNYSNRENGDLDWELKGSLAIPSMLGHWQGQGIVCNPGVSATPCGAENGPGGDLLGLRNATEYYFEGHAKTDIRKDFETLVLRIGALNPGWPANTDVCDLDAGCTYTGLLPLESTRSMQAATRFLVMRIASTSDSGDWSYFSKFKLGDPTVLDEADMYTTATIAGQGFRSAVINGEDEFNFPLPNSPPLFIKSVPKDALYPEPVTSMTVEVKTSDDRYSGTNDDVKLCVSATVCFPLDKGLYNDFEQGDRDTYSVPIDGATIGCYSSDCSTGGPNSAGRRWTGLSTRDITEVRIAKSSDGWGGAWKLGGIKLVVNGRTFYNKQDINRWLKGSSRTWQAADFTRGASLMLPGVPVTVDLWDQDSSVYWDDDHGDINEYDGRKRVAITYAPNAPTFTMNATAGHKLGGRWPAYDHDYATLGYSVSTLTPVPALVAVTPGGGGGGPGGGGDGTFTGGAAHQGLRKARASGAGRRP